MSNPKIATIVPLAHLDEIKDDEYFMALSYALENVEYAGFFAERVGEGKHVILDNSAVEMGKPEEFDTYLDKALSISASEIMLPDVFRDRYKTYYLASEAVLKLKAKYHLDIMVIPQGNNYNEWRTSCRELVHLVDPYCMDMKSALHIGVSARYTDFFNGNRGSVFGLDIDTCPVHFLGCYANPVVEIAPWLKEELVCGVDSSYPSVFSKNEMILSEDTMSMPRPMTRIDLLNDVYDETLLRFNLKAWRDACSGKLNTTA